MLFFFLVLLMKHPHAEDWTATPISLLPCITNQPTNQHVFPSLYLSETGGTQIKILNKWKFSKNKKDWYAQICECMWDFKHKQHHFKPFKHFLAQQCKEHLQNRWHSCCCCCDLRCFWNFTPNQFKYLVLFVRNSRRQTKKLKLFFFLFIFIYYDGMPQHDCDLI